MKHLSNFLRFGAVLLTSLTMLSGCGGGGGGSSPPPSGVISVTVSDAYGVNVADATVQVTVGTTTVTETTDVQGVALLLFREEIGSANVTVSGSSFVSQTVPATITANQVTMLPVTLDRATSAAGGSLTSRGNLPVVHTSHSMTFEIELVIVDGNSQPITNLSAADFVLRTCTPDLTNGKVDCVRGADAGFDVAYAPVSATPQAWELVPGASAKSYAAALLLDQSSSIYVSDPTGARLYSAKAFLDQLGDNDWALLSAFAHDDVIVKAKIPNKPLTVYSSFWSKSTLSGDSSHFSTLDSLAALVGGNTPLYAALDTLVARVASDTNLPTGIAKSVVIFTDGDDTYCGTPDTCRDRRKLSIDAANLAGVRIFTIGLSSSVNSEALGELANQTGGAFFYADSAEQLIPLYGSLGKPLSLSLPTYRLTWTVQAGSPAFQSGNALLGSVTVTAGARTFDVPFIVGIP